MAVKKQAVLTAIEIRKTAAYDSIKTSLLEQLERRGSDLPYFVGMVDDYMKLYEAKEMAAADVAARGVTIYGTGSTGQAVAKKNDAVDMLVKLNAQMLKILDQLKLRVDETAAEDDEEL